MAGHFVFDFFLNRKKETMIGKGMWPQGYAEVRKERERLNDFGQASSLLSSQKR